MFLLTISLYVFQIKKIESVFFVKFAFINDDKNNETVTKIWTHMEATMGPTCHENVGPTCHNHLVPLVITI
jgi:hypothetical protein